jgi:hypothetical protein
VLNSSNRCIATNRCPSQSLASCCARSLFTEVPRCGPPRCCSRQRLPWEPACTAHHHLLAVCNGWDGSLSRHSRRSDAQPVRGAAHSRLGAGAQALNPGRAAPVTGARKPARVPRNLHELLTTLTRPCDVTSASCAPECRVEACQQCRQTCRRVGVAPARLELLLRWHMSRAGLQLLEPIPPCLAGCVKGMIQRDEGQMEEATSRSAKAGHAAAEQ